MNYAQTFFNLAIWVCDIIAIVLLVNYLGHCYAGRRTETGNPGMALAFLLYIFGHTISRTWVVLTHLPVSRNSWVDLSSAIIATIGLAACVRMFSAESIVWVWAVLGALGVAGILTTLLG